MQLKEALSYDDILLIPQYSDIVSRSEVDIGTQLGEYNRFELPIVSSPMDTITETEMAKAMNKAGGLAIIHRYNTIEAQATMVRTSLNMNGDRCAAAVGVTGDYFERAQELVKSGAKILCLDIAHGHHSLMRDALRILRREVGPDIHLMAGNVATLEGFVDLATWGANSVRVGIGGGSICSTRTQTGHGVPTLESVVAAKMGKSQGKFSDVAIIADGGIKNSGDIIKALACGANMVMIGSLLAGTDECPGEVIKTSEGKFKTYRGMASKDAQMAWRGKTASLEGISTVVPYRGPVHTALKNLERGIKSGLSYSGARSIKELQQKVRFIVQTASGQVESSTHILKR
jgi:IMP dehydrogenase